MHYHSAAWSKWWPFYTTCGYPYENTGPPVTKRKAFFSTWMVCSMAIARYLCCVNGTLYKHSRTSMLGADDLVPIWHQTICNQCDDESGSTHVICVPYWFGTCGTCSTKENPIIPLMLRPLCHLRLGTPICEVYNTSRGLRLKTKDARYHINTPGVLG